MHSGVVLSVHSFGLNKVGQIDRTPCNSSPAIDSFASNPSNRDWHRSSRKCLLTSALNIHNTTWFARRSELNQGSFSIEVASAEYGWMARLPRRKQQTTTCSSFPLIDFDDELPLELNETGMDLICFDFDNGITQATNLLTQCT
jgi:hypothetical protein